MDYLRDYRYCLIYNANGKKMFKHEHIIWCSNYFIKKLRASEHWYIDGTWIYPKSFKQLIGILYIDNKTSKRYPALFALINNKFTEGYLELFKQIKSLVTLENSKELNLTPYTIDFELGLISALNNIFPKIRCIGCYYHYCMNIFKHAKRYKLNNNESKKINEILNEKQTPFKKNDKINSLDNIILKYNNEIYQEFFDYIINQWNNII